jgi:hypothetical protein
LQSVLAGRGVHHQQNLMGRSGDNALRGALHLFQFGHQAGLGVEPACSIDDHTVRVAGLGCVERVIKHR